MRRNENHLIARSARDTLRNVATAVSWWGEGAPTIGDMAEVQYALSDALPAGYRLTHDALSQRIGDECPEHANYVLMAKAVRGSYAVAFRGSLPEVLDALATGVRKGFKRGTDAATMTERFADCVGA